MPNAFVCGSFFRQQEQDYDDGEPRVPVVVFVADSFSWVSKTLLWRKYFDQAVTCAFAVDSAGADVCENVLQSRAWQDYYVLPVVLF